MSTKERPLVALERPFRLRHWEKTANYPHFVGRLLPSPLIHNVDNFDPKIAAHYVFLWLLLIYLHFDFT